jgi:hypothetical protein
MCCGAGRAALRAEMSIPQGIAGGRRAGGHSSPTGRAVRYLGSGRMRVRGSSTGAVYDFSGGRQMSVSPADVAALVRSGLFVQG